MMYKALRSIEEAPLCFWRSSYKFQGDTGQNIADVDPNWLLPHCYSSLNLQMATKYCIKLGYERCPIVFQGHLSTRLKKVVDFEPN